MKTEGKKLGLAVAIALEKKNDREGAVNAWKAYLNLAQPNSIWWNKAKERLDDLEKNKGS